MIFVVNVGCKYIVVHKTCTFIFHYTSRISCEILHLLYQWRQERIFYYNSVTSRLYCVIASHGNVQFIK